MKRFAIYWTVLTLLSAFPLTLSAQGAEQVGKSEITISDAWVSREGRTLIIDYDITMGGNFISCDVALMMSVDGGRTFSPVTATDKIKGDVGRITTSGQKRIVYDIDSIKERLAGKELAFKVQVKNKKRVQDNKGKFFEMGTASTFGMYGAKMGYVKKFGAYAAYSDTFSGGMFDNFTITAGGIMRATSWLYPYVGVGYGQLNFWEYCYTTYGLIPFEAGAMLKLGPVSLSAAVEPIIVLGKGLACTFEFGIGFCF